MAMNETRSYPRLLADITALARRAEPGERLDIWCFEGVAARRSVEAALAERGVSARIRSAYKPLVHAFLEELPPIAIAAAKLTLPAHAAAADSRFRLEAYPLAGLIGPASLEFIAGGSALDYTLDLGAHDGARHRLTVFAPNRTRIDHLGETVLAPCGWIRIGTGEGAWRIDEPIMTEVEALYLDLMAIVAQHPWGAAEPFFDRLTIEVDIPAIDRPLDFGDEIIHTCEALHEEIYFSLLEVFQRYSGRPLGARDLRPGQIVPIVRASAGDARLAIRTERFAVDTFAYVDADEPLDQAERPLSPDRVARELAALGGDAFAALSREGRAVMGASFQGAGPGISISGGQHANEASGIVGALRAARRLKFTGRRFAVTPLENPDGYALHHRLRADHPRHMHHAARYTAFGDDLGHRIGDGPDLYETEARLEGFRRSDCVLHINLHGYPAHEWTRPLTGYVPRGFGHWALPKGFFLILVHRADHADLARTFITAITRRLADELPEMIAFTAEQMRIYRVHVGEMPYEVIAGIPVMMREVVSAPVPLELITEFPDETIYGDAFRLAHKCQTHATVAAAEIFAELWQDAPV